MRTNVTLYLSESEFRSLQRIAADSGYVQTTGYGAGSAPNVSALIRAIAGGRVALVGPTPAPEEAVEALDSALLMVPESYDRNVLVLIRAEVLAVVHEASGGLLRGGASGKMESN